LAFSSQTTPVKVRPKVADYSSFEQKSEKEGWSADPVVA
jgi:hypothetical protein